MKEDFWIFFLLLLEWGGVRNDFDWGVFFERYDLSLIGVFIFIVFFSIKGWDGKVRNISVWFWVVIW